MMTQSHATTLQPRSCFTAGPKEPYNFTTDITDHIKTNCSIWLPREKDFETKLAYCQALRKAINPEFFFKNDGSFIADATDDIAMQNTRIQEVKALEQSLRKEGRHVQSFSESFPECYQRQLASYSIQLEVGQDTFSFSWVLNLLFVVFMFFYSRFRPTSPKPAPPMDKVAREVRTPKAPPVPNAAPPRLLKMVKQLQHKKPLVASQASLKPLDVSQLGAYHFLKTQTKASAQPALARRAAQTAATAFKRCKVMKPAEPKREPSPSTPPPAGRTRAAQLWQRAKLPLRAAQAGKRLVEVKQARLPTKPKPPAEPELAPSPPPPALVKQVTAPTRTAFREFHEIKAMEPRFEPSPQQAKKLKARNFIRYAGRRERKERKIKEALLDRTLAAGRRRFASKEKQALLLPAKAAKITLPTTQEVLKPTAERVVAAWRPAPKAEPKGDDFNC